MRRALWLAATLAALVAAGPVLGSSIPASRTPFTLLDGTEAGGLPLLESSPQGMGVRFIDRGTFWVALALENRTSKPVTIDRVATPEPAGSLVTETTARFEPYPGCNPRLACPYFDSRAPAAVAPVTVAPHATEAVKLGYRLVSCAQARASTTASGSRIVVTYGAGGGSGTRETFPVGAFRLELQAPAGIECVPRPASHIGLVGSFTTSPQHLPVPGSDGDTCTVGGGGLDYLSRLFESREQIEFRVQIALPRFRGLGTYGVGAQSRGKALVVVTGGFGDAGNSTFRDARGTVTVTQATGSTRAGRFEAVLSGHRRFFRAYGAWRCAVLPSSTIPPDPALAPPLPAGWAEP